MAIKAGKKRMLEDSASATPAPKKAKLSTGIKTSVQKPTKRKERAEEPSQAESTLRSEELDFPRGGGSSFTPLEVKEIRAEGLKEAEDEIFKEEKNTRSKKRRKSEGAPRGKGTAQDGIRVEHLNYKRLTPGMKILGQIVAVQALALIVSLPNQLLGHIPIINITNQLTERLEAMDDGEEVEDEEKSDDDEIRRSSSRLPELSDMFAPGRYVQTAVSAVHQSGTTTSTSFDRRPRDDAEKASRRVELSLIPQNVNAGLSASNLKPSFTLPAAVKSVEDHGYILDLGLPEVSGFLSFDDAKKGPFANHSPLPVGWLMDACVAHVSKNGRAITMSVDPTRLATSTLSEVSNAASLLPGALVQCLITAVVPSGLNLQVVGFFEGTVDRYHLDCDDLDENFKVGQKVKARILYQSDATPPKFVLSLARHVLALQAKTADEDRDDDTLQSAFPIGTVLEAVKVLRVEPERGLVVRIGDDLTGFVHISQTSDDHVPTLQSASGPWKVGTTHRARVTGHIQLDGMLQLSLRASVLDQKFLRVEEVQVGEVVKGTIKKLTDSALFVSLAGNVDGVIWPNHYADIMLKHPQKRFKPGNTIKCRVLVVDPDRRRIVLTAKKTLVESKLPLISSWDQAKVGVVTTGVVFKVGPKSFQIEFCNNLKALVPAKEISDMATTSLAESFPIGKPLTVRIISVDPEARRILASVRQVSTSSQNTFADVSKIEIGSVVQGKISELHKDQALLCLLPTQVRGLISLVNLATASGTSVDHLRRNLKPGQVIDNLVVVSRNADKGLAIVVSKPQGVPGSQPRSALSWDTVLVGQRVHGRVLSHSRRGAVIKLGSRVNGTLHPTDCCDDFASGSPFPAVGTVVAAVVVSFEKSKNVIVLSSRESRMEPDGSGEVTDPEIQTLEDLQVGQPIRGFVKSVAEHGLFVSIGRNIDARVQIKELFDDFVKDWKSSFQANQLVKARILRIDIEKRQVELTFRSGDRLNVPHDTLKLSDICKGQKFEGRVKKVEEYGLFIEIEGSRLSGLCHKSEVSDNPGADVSIALRGFREGDRVKVVVLSVDPEKRRISLGLKPSYFDEDDFNESDADSLPSEGEGEVFGVVPEDDLVSDPTPNPIQMHSSHESSDEDEEHATLNTRMKPAILSKKASVLLEPTPSATLKLDSGFQWTADKDVDGEESGLSDSSGAESQDGEGRTTAKRRRRKQIEQDLTADMHTKTPESNAEFERLLLGSPNSSYLWIQYMSFQVQLSEVDKAREIGRRALRAINFREEQEKLNVWVALMNLENVHGSETTLETVFKEAARSNDSKTVHLRLATILDQSQKHTEAENLYSKTAKKFGHSSKVWSLFGEHYFRLGRPEDARKLLPRSLQSLEKRKHLKTISKFAQLEYRQGDPERGKTIFEGIVDSHPKRWDLWSVYIDMEASQGSTQAMRQLFDRVLGTKMTSHKAKAFFKKWLELERRAGDEAGADAVKEKAIAWTQKAANRS